MPAQPPPRKPKPTTTAPRRSIFPTLEEAGHSLRSGFLTSAAENGASIWKLSEVSRHKSLNVLSGVRGTVLFVGPGALLRLRQLHQPFSAGPQCPHQRAHLLHLGRSHPVSCLGRTNSRRTLRCACPVLRPPCRRHRPFFIAGDWHGVVWNAASMRVLRRLWHGRSGDGRAHCPTPDRPLTMRERSHG
jgi:hypothetical protein